MGITARQIARMLGVAPSTVTRALQDNPRISPATKEKIRKIAMEHGYHLAGEAAGPEMLSTNIGLVIANPQGGLASDEFFSEVVNGVSAYLRERRRHLLVEAVDNPAGLPALLAEKKVAGLITGGIPIEDAYIEALLATGVPVVFIGKYLKDHRRLHAVIPDNVAGGELVGNHLVECGYEEFVFLGGDLRINTFQDRLEGFRIALQRHGYTLPRANIITGQMGQEGGYLGLKNCLARLSGRIGVFASTDWMAAGAIRAFKEAGLSLPEQVGLVGYSDLPLASALYPSLTTVRVDRQLLGFMAARLLLDVTRRMIARPVQVHIQPELVVRESTSSPQGGKKTGGGNDG